MEQPTMTTPLDELETTFNDEIECCGDCEMHHINDILRPLGIEEALIDEALEIRRVTPAIRSRLAGSVPRGTGVSWKSGGKQ